MATNGFTVKAQSWGYEDPRVSGPGYSDNTFIVINGQKKHKVDVEPHGRGHQVFILNERTGQVVDEAAFDTYSGGGGAAAANQLTTYLEGVAEGRIIVIAVHDSGDSPVNLAPYGSTITRLGPRESYAMIIQKGETPYWFVEKKSAKGAGPTIVETFIPTVGRFDWQPIFRILPGVGGEKVVDLWTTGLPSDFGSDPWLFPAAQYKSPLVDLWETLGVQLVKVSLYTYKQGLTEVRDLIFDGRNTDKLNWFCKERLISSPWTDLKTETTNIFSIAGEVGNPKAPRSFFINRNYGGCAKDAGWLVVAEGGTVCDWEKRDPRVPHILYSKKSTFVNWTTGGDDVGTADVMVISIKTK